MSDVPAAAILPPIPVPPLHVTYPDGWPADRVGDPSGTIWTCLYCGGIRLVALLRCDGCGAPRMAP